MKKHNPRPLNPRNRAYKAPNGGSGTLPVTIYVVDPEKRSWRRMSIVPSVKAVRALIGTISLNLGWRKLIEDLDGEILFVASKADVDPAKPLKEWRVRGGSNTAGKGMLFGSFNRSTDGMWDVPKSVDDNWLERHIVWCEPGENAAAEEVLAVQRDAECLAAVHDFACDRCGEKPVVADLDGDRLCQKHADEWVRGEGMAASELPETDMRNDPAEG